ncbi:MAG: hypothetical protein GY711_17415 [bacterium]|nr:hypothetical protein [bacterium]
MSTRVHNLRHWHRARAITAIVPALVVPLAIVGLTVQPGMEVVKARNEMRAARELVREAEIVRAESRRLGGPGQTNTIEQLADELRRMVPNRVTKMEIHSLARVAAGRHGFDLRSIRISDSKDTGIGPDASPVFARDVRLGGKATPSALVLFLDELRTMGLPVTTLDFSMHRDGPASTRFRSELVVGVFHYGPPRQAAHGTSDDPVSLLGGDR